MSECNQEVFSFAAHFSRRVEVSFTAGQVSSDGGALLLRQADRKINLLGRLATCFTDRRSPHFVTHQLTEMLSQRIYGLALGYEDINDHEQLRADPLMGVLSGKRKLDEPLAGKSTLNRLELPGGSQRYHKIDYAAEKIDALLCARLRPANQDAAAGSVAEVSRIVTQLRERWPRVKVVLRADSGFCREELMAWCEREENHVDYVFGLARNKRLQKIIGAQMHQARVLHQSTGKAARVFTEFDYRTRKSWSCSRRVVAKAEFLDKGENPRFIVTSLTADEWAAQHLYEKFYCARGEMENRIKEQMCLFADRLSTDEMKGNQLRLYFSALAYTLVEALRRLALKGTAWAEARVDTIRLKLLKIGAIVSISVRRIVLQLSSTYPWKDIYAAAFHALRC